MKDTLPDARVGKEREIEIERGGSVANWNMRKPSGGVGYACHAGSGL